MIKTIELILGLPTMSLFDLIANDMRNSFQAVPDFTPYTAVEPEQSIYELNPPLKSLKGTARRDAEASMHMNWLVPDAIPTPRLNSILWRNAKVHTRKCRRSGVVGSNPLQLPIRLRRTTSNQ